MVVASATVDENNGNLTVKLTNVRYIERDFATDQPVQGGSALS